MNFNHNSWKRPFFDHLSGELVEMNLRGFFRERSEMTDVAKPEPPTIPCSAGCKRRWLADDIEASGWERLPITGWYRCPDCTRELTEVSDRLDNLKSLCGIK